MTAAFTGWKTLLASALAILVGVADMLQFVDLTPFLSAWIGDERVVGKVVATLGFLFALLRVVTYTGIFAKEEEE
jgi:hypothetical protein